MKALAWMVIDPNARRSIFTDEGRAEQGAVVQHGIKVELYRAEKVSDAVAWLIHGHRGRWFAVLLKERAEQLARDVGGTATPLAPLAPISTLDPDAGAIP